jgi:NDP-sugar pyrophosphorylase family protein
MAYFGDGSRLGVKLTYSLEEAELSTIGPLTLIDDLPEDFLVMNGDILCNLDYRAFFESHIAAKRQISVSSYRRQVKIDFGVIYSDAFGHLTSFQEKPEFNFDVSMGIYCINRSVIEALPKGGRYGFDNLMIDGVSKKQQINICPFSGYWLDIGRPDDYEYANENFSELSVKLGL